MMINNTLFITAKNIEKSDLNDIYMHDVFNLVAPFLEQIGEATFQEFRNLRFAWLPNLLSCQTSAFEECTVLFKIIVPKLHFLSAEVFLNCISLSSL